MANSVSDSDPAQARRAVSYFRNRNSGDAGPTHKPILVMEEVYKYFRRDVPTLRNVNLSINRGEFVFVTGPSGSGKSTLLQLIYRQHTVDSGRVLFSGRDISRLTDRSIPFLRRNLGIVFQDFKVVPHWTVFENTAVSLEILGTSTRLVRTRVAQSLERVGLAGRGQERTENLSGGEQQRVAIARAIVTEPALLLADEPTGNLDPQLAIDILTLFEEIHAAGTTVLFATHDHSLLQSAPHRLVVIDEGRVIEASQGLRAWSTRNDPGQAATPPAHPTRPLTASGG